MLQRPLPVAYAARAKALWMRVLQNIDRDIACPGMPERATIEVRQCAHRLVHPHAELQSDEMEADMEFVERWMEEREGERERERERERESGLGPELMAHRCPQANE